MNTSKIIIYDVDPKFLYILLSEEFPYLDRKVLLDTSRQRTFELGNDHDLAIRLFNNLKKDKRTVARLELFFKDTDTSGGYKGAVGVVVDED